jgi:hypothetical protein
MWYFGWGSNVVSFLGVDCGVYWWGVVLGWGVGMGVVSV